MRKPRITRTWLGGLVAIGVGVLVLLAGLGLMLGLGGTWRGPSNNVTFTPKYDPFFWGTVTMMATGGAVLSCGPRTPRHTVRRLTSDSTEPNTCEFASPCGGPTSRARRGGIQVS